MCNTTTGCVFTPRACTPPNNCTISECSESLQRCVYTPKVCDSRDACIVDTCDPILGCQTTAVVCNDDNECTTDRCDSQLGCQYASAFFPPPRCSFLTLTAPGTRQTPLAPTEMPARQIFAIQSWDASICPSLGEHLFFFFLFIPDLIFFLSSFPQK